ncbi:MAG: alginate export family protein [Mariprofundaceae bacterium]
MKRNLKILCGVMSLIFTTGLLQAAEWTTSADLRERYQSFNNFDFNDAIDDDRSEFDSRLFVKAKGTFDSGLSVFLQPQAVIVQNTTVANGTQNFSQADFYQAYLEYNVDHYGVRVGRQQLVYGNQRLLGHLGWKDVARTFDGIKAHYKRDAFKVDLFAVHPADIGAMTPKTSAPQGKALVTWEDRRLIGLYGTYSFAKKTGIDAYLINWSHGDAASVGVGRNINTFGARAFGKWGAIDATAEFTGQSGTWATGVSQSASALALQAGYSLDMWKTRLGIEFDYSPGDDKMDATTHKDFVFQFHTNHAHYGEMDRFSWANMSDLRLSVKTSPMQGLTFIANIHLLSLTEAKGDWLNVVGAGKLYAGNASYMETDAGNEIDLKLVYKPAAMKGLKLVANYSIFNPGDAVAERNGGAADTASFGYLIAQYQF